MITIIEAFFEKSNNRIIKSVISLNLFRNHFQLQFIRQLEGSSLEVAHVSREGTCPFGKYYQWYAVFQRWFCLPHGGKHFLGAGTVDEDMSCAFACLTDKRDFAQALLHHPFEVPSQESVYQEYVEGTLVIGHKHVGSTFVYFLPSMYLHRNKQYIADELWPDFTGIVPPGMRPPYQRTDNGDQCCKDSQYQ